MKGAIFLINALAIIVSYLLGAVNFSFLYGRLFRGIDIRQHGSGNAGATNTLRVLGKGPGILVLVLDVLKGVGAVAIGYWSAAPDQLWVPVLCGLLSIVGHNWPIYFGFRGGKGVATTIGVMATLAFIPTLIACIAAVVVIAVTRYVSLGSLIIALLIPVLLLVMKGPAEIIAASVILCLFVYIRHRSNIVKLWTGKENKLGAKVNKG
ncbi:glycerol-3-phosphate 1-O-acyltransferase PlsY [Paenibacillus chartarius]|uniref:Glycerol-3-phosphate acyltransferase n=1 Tax=Paenibacillus chartarius TaxID=747481 RepID=A0ABV6DQE5_9BACL